MLEKPTLEQLKFLVGLTPEEGALRLAPQYKLQVVWREFKEASGFNDADDVVCVDVLNGRISWVWPPRMGKTDRE